MKVFVTLLVGLALMLAPSAALAQSSQCQTYGSETCGVTDATQTSAESSLPFTGIDVPVLVALGGGLLGVGLVARRVSRQTN